MPTSSTIKVFIILALRVVMLTNCIEEMEDVWLLQPFSLCFGNHSYTINEPYTSLSPLDLTSSANRGSEQRGGSLSFKSSPVFLIFGTTN